MRGKAWNIEISFFYSISHYKRNLFSREKLAASAISFCFSSSVMLRQVGSEPVPGSGVLLAMFRGAWNGDESLGKEGYQMVI